MNALRHWMTRNRIKPIVAIKAISRLLQDPDDTGQVFKIIEALKGDGITAPLKRLKADPVGAAMLEQRINIVTRLNDRDALLAMPEGSIGRAYYDFVHSQGLSADGLIAAREEAPDYDGLSEEEQWFANRLRDIHDLQHVLTGYGRDPLGELSLLSFMTTQVENRGINFIIFIGGRKFKGDYPQLDIKGFIAEGRAIGKKAAWMPAIRWEDRLHEPLQSVRNELGFQAPINYQAVDYIAQDLPSAA
ncbi:hypothetical protein EYC87_16150 [Halieaceae bacterium IMCC8485]|jgi:ubiquinone biosynthesis protein COQ4|uniref:Ubiquinone biosynthesis protein n=1 Tax=Candidatus Seongchinamella marina TaxID=2518990 RepID=A0ABT3SYN5_9GAMM|nr:Coq4 family protein [Candidatus Seongchinamella marina]MCX2975117.1 hypothetical protein [Candidatus Seongchinamella marina]